MALVKSTGYSERRPKVAWFPVQKLTVWRIARIKEPVHLAYESRAGEGAKDGSAVVDPVNAQREAGVALTAHKLERVLGPGRQDPCFGSSSRPEPRTDQAGDYP